VGVGSEGEWMDFFVRERLDALELPAVLGAELPLGMQALRVDELPCQGRAPVALRESFALHFSRAEDKDRFAGRLEEFLRAGEWKAPKLTKKGEPGEIDVRPMIQSASLDADGFVLSFNWRDLYVSPVFVLQAVDRDFSLLQARLVKTRQFFDDAP